jgi:hypothetical protein
MARVCTVLNENWYNDYKVWVGRLRGEQICGVNEETNENYQSGLITMTNKCLLQHTLINM